MGIFGFSIWGIDMADWTFILALFGGLTALILGFAVGKFMDNNWRCRTMRRILKQNYILLNITQKNGKTIHSQVVNADNDIAIVGGKMWVLKGGKIYDQKDKRKSYFFKEKEIKYIDGAPVVFVNNEDLTPLDFYQNNEGIIKPDEIGSTLLAWVFNQMNKNLSSVKNMQLFQTIMLVGVVLVLVLSFFNMQDLGEMREQITALNAKVSPTIVPEGGQIKDGNIVINQDKKTGSTSGGG